MEKEFGSLSITCRKCKSVSVMDDAGTIERITGYSCPNCRSSMSGRELAFLKSVFSSIVRIRSKKAKGEKLDKGEEKYYQDNKQLIDLKPNISAEEHTWKKELPGEKQSGSSAWIAAAEIIQRCADALLSTALCGGIAWVVKRRARRQ